MIPPARMKEWDGHWWYRIPNSEEYIHLGICAAPKGMYQTIRYHILHGLLMNYPLLSIIKFAWRNRKSYE